MLKVIDSVFSLCFLLLIFIMGENTLIALGGSVSLIILIPFFYYISYVLKKFQLAMTLLSLALLLIVGINCLNYFDLSGIYTKAAISIPYCALVVTINFCLCFALIEPLNYSHDDAQYNEVVVLRQNFKLIVFKYTMFPFVYILSICLVFNTFHELPSIKNDIIKMIPTSLIFLPAFLVGMKITLKGMGSDNLDLIFRKVESRPPERLNLKTGYFVLMCIIFPLGSVIELSRNEWILWTETFLIINIIIILIWYNYKHRLGKGRDVSSVKLLGVKPLNTPQTLIKVVAVNTIGVTLSSFSLIVLLYFLNK